ncbi:hypothetical protein GQ43DRAFT_114199 [Delitschia confertaspora ATCC 74209]|uniref:Uncharacterized protein n=1 Tax=Delitschia confertaspora ATCC 74209 TaxID=1513339 RepID=A0A9P4MX13_9PLEO|nr:hypothetical protein GQ43DRAFT_114199 [Delitschia confertaspora ATCC 74209]
MGHNMGTSGQDLKGSIAASVFLLFHTAWLKSEASRQQAWSMRLSPLLPGFRCTVSIYRTVGIGVPHFPPSVGSHRATHGLVEAESLQVSFASTCSEHKSGNPLLFS